MIYQLRLLSTRLHHTLQYRDFWWSAKRQVDCCSVPTVRLLLSIAVECQTMPNIASKEEIIFTLSELGVHILIKKRAEYKINTINNTFLISFVHSLAFKQDKECPYSHFISPTEGFVILCYIPKQISSPLTTIRPLALSLHFLYKIHRLLLSSVLSKENLCLITENRAKRTNIFAFGSSVKQHPNITQTGYK